MQRYELDKIGALIPIVNGKRQDKNINMLIKEIDVLNHELLAGEDKFPEYKE